MSYLRGPFSKQISVQTVLFHLGIWILCFAPMLAYAQDDLNIHGVVSDAMTSSKLDGVKVTAKKNGVAHDTFTTRANGKYEFYLDCDSRYDLVFQKDGYVDRSIQIDASNVPPEIIGAGIIMPTDMSMYKITEAMEGADLSVFNEPIGKAKYDAAQGDLVWDFNYTNKVKGDIMSFMRDIEKKQKELDKQGSEADKAALAQEEKFNQHVKDGDAAMAKSNFENGVLNYQAALAIKPDNLPVQGKLGDAQTKLNNQKAAAEKEASYSAALDKGDGFMRTEEYDKAIESYNAALKIKPDESYPKDQVVKAQKIIKDRADNLAKQDQFNKLMGEGATAFDGKKYEDALGKYLEAQAVLPDNNEVAKKIKATQEAIANKDKLAKIQADYDALIASADQKFSSNNFKEALPDYQAAAKLLPDETYPAERIAACNAKIAENAAAAEKQASFDALMTEGTDALTATNYPSAIEKFNAALAIIPNEATATAKLKEAQGLLNEKNALAEKQENYDALIADADELFGNDQFAEAKTKYQVAKQLIPEETYPLDQITKIDAKLKEMADSQKAQETYDAAMAAGQSAEDGKKYAEAISQYQAALAVFADDKAAKNALDNATKLKAEFDKTQAAEAEYASLIASADQKFASKNFQEAIQDYQAAAKLLPEETYPTERIAECNAQIAENLAAAEKQESFDAMMKEGTDALTATNYPSAIEKFNAALAIIPNETTAAAKLKEAQGLLNEKNAQAEKQENYDALIADADKLFGKDEFAEAKTKYQEAKQLIPEETYPLDQITKIDAKLKEMADSQKAQETYDAAMAAGQSAEEGKKYAEAISQYQAALAVFADDKAAKTALENATKLKADYDKTLAAGEKYESLVAAADESFQAGKYESARANYQEALGIKSDEAYPKSQLELIAIAIAENEKEAAEAANQAKLQAEYDGFMSAGDIAMGKTEFAEAIDQYEKALDVKVGDAAATNKRDVAQSKLKELEGKMAIDDQYNAKIADADKKYDKNDLQNALTAYQEASQLKDSEKYPKDQIALIQEKIATEAAAAAAAEMKAKTDQVNALVLEGDNFVNANSFEKGIVKYEEALSILPDRADVTAKRDDAMKRMLTFMESAANEEAYESAIENGDKAYKKENWKVAKSEYESALSIKANEQYPKDQIADIDLKIAAAASEAEKARQAELQSNFDDLIAGGDKEFKRKKYNEALTAYQLALDLLPGNEVAIEKIGAVNEILGQLDAEKNAAAKYEALVKEGDDLFTSESYEMARLKYLDAQELMPSEKYPPKRISEIDILLEKQRLAASQEELAAREKAYNDAVKVADDYFTGSKYDEATDSYNEALAIKPGEVYPLGQIEKIKLLKEKEAARIAEKNRLAEKDEVATTTPDRKKELVSVNTNSEEQAEQFMRDALEAQEREKYERIKKQKELYAKNNADYRAGSDVMRQENLNHIESLESSLELQNIESSNNRNEKVNNSVDYKQSLLNNQSNQTDTEAVHRKDAYNQIKKDESNRSNWFAGRKQSHDQKVRKEGELKEQQLQKMQEWSEASTEERAKLNQEYQKNASQRYNDNKVASDLRNDRAKDLSEKKDQILEDRNEAANADLDKVRKTSQELAQQQESYLASKGSMNADKITAAAQQFEDQKERYAANSQDSQKMADKRREDAMSEAKKLFENSPKEYADYYRSLLAVNYPQGVSEESSTMGNKVIIIRIVVKGNRGDEYKKVLDKSGNYYFKNGLSISENTWNRETIDAFNNKSKD